MQDLKNTINQVIEIQDILFNNPPTDKKFKKNEFNYILDLFMILNDIEQDKGHYSDETMQKRINNLHNRIFKNRRY